MKLKNLLISVGAFALVSSFAVGLVTSHDDEMTRTEAATGVWGIAGSMNGWSVKDGYKFTDEDADGTAELEITFKVNDEFKFKYSGDWNNAVGASFSAYYPTLFGGSDNIKVLQAGTYVFLAPTDLVITNAKTNSLTADKISVLGHESNKPIWGLAGSMNGWNVSEGYKFTDKDADGTAELVVDLAIDDEFKIKYAGDWKNPIGGTFGGLFGDKGGNAQVLKAGQYTFKAPTDKAITFATTNSLKLADITVEYLEGETYTLVGGQPLYLQVSNESFDWSSDGAKFGFYYYNGDANAWSAHFLTEVKGASTKIYEDIVPEGEWTTVIAIRFNAEATELRWNSGDEDHNIWNQSVNVTVIENMNIISVTDWGTDKCLASAANTFTTTSRAYCWANHLLATVVCDGAGSNEATEEGWADLKAQYDAMHADAQKILKETEVTTAREDITDGLEKALDRYDYIVDKYADNEFAGKAWMTDFIGRVEVTGANRLITSLTNNNNMVMIIVISSVVAVLGVSVFFIYRRKRNVQ